MQIIFMGCLALFVAYSTLHLHCDVNTGLGRSAFQLFTFYFLGRKHVNDKNYIPSFLYITDEKRTNT